MGLRWPPREATGLALWAVQQWQSCGVRMPKTKKGGDEKSLLPSMRCRCLARSDGGSGGVASVIGFTGLVTWQSVPDVTCQAWGLEVLEGCMTQPVEDRPWGVGVFPLPLLYGVMECRHRVILKRGGATTLQSE